MIHLAAVRGVRRSRGFSFLPAFILPLIDVYKQILELEIQSYSVSSEGERGLG